MSEDDVFEEEVGTIYRDEVNAYMRSSVGGKFSELLSTAATSSGDQKKDRQILSPEDRFLTVLRATCLKLREEKIYDITNTDIDNMLEKTQRIIGLRYRNPIAYILGYIATKNGTRLEPPDVKYVINTILPKLDTENGITAPDVVRYARFWKRYLN